MPEQPCLEDQILSALKLALADNRLDVAEHLLRALEALGLDPAQDSPVADAYRSIAAMTKTSRPQ